MSGNTFNITNRIDGDTGAPIPVAVTAAAPNSSTVVALILNMVLTHLAAALALWILAATLMPWHGITFWTTWGVVIAFRLLTYRRRGLNWWVHPARKLG